MDQAAQASSGFKVVQEPTPPYPWVVDVTKDEVAMLVEDYVKGVQMHRQAELALEEAEALGASDPMMQFLRGTVRYVNNLAGEAGAKMCEALGYTPMLAETTCSCGCGRVVTVPRYPYEDNLKLVGEGIEDMSLEQFIELRDQWNSLQKLRAIFGDGIDVVAAALARSVEMGGAEEGEETASPDLN